MTKLKQDRKIKRFTSMSKDSKAPPTSSNINQRSLNPTAIPFHNTQLTQSQLTTEVQTNNPHLNVPPVILPAMLPAAPQTVPNLELLIRNIVKETLQSERKCFADEQILDTANIGDLDKIPDIVKVLREFSGEQAEYLAWRKSIDRVIELYGHLRGTAKFYGIISVIRNKIIGQANIALEAYNTPLNWDAIKECLNTHYADKRDIGTLEYQLNTLIQGGNSIEQFYQKVYKQFSLILNKLSGSEMDKATENAFIDSYRKKALDTFIRGLNGDLPRLLAVHEPTDLPQALYMCTKLANQNYRTQFANQQTPNTPPQLLYKQPPKLPPRKYQNINPQHMFPQFYSNPAQRYQTMHPHSVPKQFHPNLAHFGGHYQQQPQYNQNRQNQYQNPQNFNSVPTPPRPSAPKPQPPPQPMSIEHSLRSAAVNYSNRPKQGIGLLGKRANDTPQSAYNNWKQQRNFHIETQTPYNTFESQEMAESVNEYEDQNFADYLREMEQEDNCDEHQEKYADTTDIHFLG